MLHPIKTSSVPVAECESHLRDIRGHVLKIRTAVSGFHHKFATILCKGHLVAVEYPILLNEFSLYMEFVFSIDLVLATKPIFTLGIVENI